MVEITEVVVVDLVDMQLVPRQCQHLQLLLQLVLVVLVLSFKELRAEMELLQILH